MALNTLYDMKLCLKEIDAAAKPKKRGVRQIFHYQSKGKCNQCKPKKR